MAYDITKIEESPKVLDPPFSVIQKGSELDSKKYEWDPVNFIFKTKEDFLILDFDNYFGVEFHLGSYTTVISGFSCTFKAGAFCTFITNYGCVFETDESCIFYTDDYCSFKTKDYCMFKTYNECEFNVGKGGVIMRQDIDEIIQPPPNKLIKLNGYGIKGYLTEEEIIMKGIIE